MFRFVHRNLQHHIRIREPTTIHVNNVCVVVFLLQCQNPHLKSISNISESKNPSSITVDYLMNSCGLSPETALSASKMIHLSSTEKPDSVLIFFQNHGFTKTQITQLISNRPKLLLLDPNKILKPKIEFLHHDLGFSGPNLFKLLSYDSSLLTRSLHKQIIPTFNFLKRFIGNNNDILATMKRTAWGFNNLDKSLMPNISILRDRGVSECSISKLLMSQPVTLMHKADRFKEILEAVKELGFNSSSPMYVYAVQIVGCMSKSRWEEKLEVYRSFGFSESEILSAIRRQPFCMVTSKEKLRRVVEFFMEKLKWKPVDIALQAQFILLSFEKRIFPRCAVLEILESKGMIRRKVKVTSMLVLTEKKFYDKFVMKYHETIPEVVKAYRGGIEFSGFGERRMWWG